MIDSVSLLQINSEKLSAAIRDGNEIPGLYFDNAENIFSRFHLHVEPSAPNAEYIIVKDAEITTSLLLNTPKYQRILFLNCKIWSIAFDDLFFLSFTFWNCEIEDFHCISSCIKRFSLANTSINNFRIEQSGIGILYFDVLYPSEVKGKIVIENAIVQHIDIQVSRINEIEVRSTRLNAITADTESNVGKVSLHSSLCNGAGFKGKLEKFFAEFSGFSLCLSENGIALIDCKLSTITSLKLGVKMSGETRIRDCTIFQLDLQQLLLASQGSILVSGLFTNEIIFDDTFIYGKFIINGLIATDLDKFSYKEGQGIGPLRRLSPAVSDEIITINNEIPALNVDRLSIFNDKCLPIIRIKNSSLGSLEMVACNLKSFYLHFQSSAIVNTTLYGSFLPDIEKVYTVRSAKDASEYYRQRIAYFSQVRSIYLKQNDLIESSTYLSHLSTETGRLLWHLYRTERKKRHIFDYIIFKLNGWSNKHGTSFVQAIGFLFISSFSIYSLYLFTLGYQPVIPTSVNDFTFVGNYFIFLDPTHKYDAFVDSFKKLTVGAKFFDFLGRILVGYSIYQFIAAFRKNSLK